MVSVDLEETQRLFIPCGEDLLTKTGLGNYVKLVREKTGYNWFLHNEIKQHSENYQCMPIYDLCIIDGPKNWTIDGMAFFLVDKLLKPGGWIIFDDYAWTYYDNEKKGFEVTDGITHRLLSEEERTIPQIKEVFQLLVMQHPSYSNFRIHGEGDWAWAQKVTNPAKINVSVEYNMRFKDLFSRIFKVTNRLFKFRKTN